MANAVISPAFTIDDIHRIREANYEFTKHMTTEEKLEYYNSAGKAAEREIAKRRALKREMAPSSVIRT